MTAYWRLGHRPDLDALRGLACIGVLIAHTRPGPFHHAGAVGVDVFLVLSGFLITSLLIEERSATGKIDVRWFFRRRAARLIPALVLLAAVVQFSPLFHASDSAVTAALTYTVNIHVIAGGDLWPLTHAWTLAVEEHFYLLWPLLLVAARYRFTAAAIALVVSSTLWRIWLLANGADLMRVYVGTDTRLADIAVGCLCAVAVARGWRVPRLVTPLALAALVGASTLGMASHLWGLPVIQLLAAALIVSLATKGTGLLAYRPLTWVGGLSYGLYLWHYPILGLFGERAHLPVSDIAAGLALTVVVSVLSMKFVEAPIRRRVSRRRPAPAMVHPAQALDLGHDLLGGLRLERAQPEVESWCRFTPPPTPGQLLPAKSEHQTMAIGDVEVDARRRLAKHDSQVVHPTPTELDERSDLCGGSTRLHQRCPPGARQQGASSPERLGAP